MTKLLEEMISQIHQLSPEEQDAIAKRHCVIASNLINENFTARKNLKRNFIEITIANGRRRRRGI